MTFSAAWLNLREPFDVQARNRIVLTSVIEAFADRTAMTIADLACGTGATYRALASRLAAKQRWRLYDNDLGLLARAGRAPNVTTVPLDLAHDLEAALDGPVDLVTTSALLDLVSDEWLERFVVEAAARRLPVYAALTYDGRASLKPVDPFDAGILIAVNAHQRRDKGFGPALGPEAARAVITRFEAVGYEVQQGLADWVFGPLDREIQEQTLAGWATAAREIGLPVSDVASWLARRRDLIAAGRSTVRVGHVDVFARPTGTR
jgi:hypothetical protein